MTDLAEADRTPDEPQGEAAKVSVPEGAATEAKPEPWPDTQGHAQSAVEALGSRLRIVEYLIEKELDDINAMRRAITRSQSHLHTMGAERTAIKRAMEALAQEEAA